MIGERPREIARGEHAVLRDAGSMWRIAHGYVSLDVGTFDREGLETGERAFMYNAVAGDVVTAGSYEEGGVSYAVVLTAAANATLEEIDPQSVTVAERETLTRRFTTLFDRFGAVAPAAVDGEPFAATAQRCFAGFARAYVASIERDLARETLRSTVGVSLDRTALYRESFEASHILDRHPIPVDPTDDDITAAARIVVSRLGVPLVTPMKADRDHVSALRAIGLASGLVVRRTLLRGRWWSGEHGPMVAFAKSDGRPLALVPRRKGAGYEAIEPLDPRRTAPVDDVFAASLDAVGFLFAPTLPMAGAGVLSLLGIGLRDSTRDLVRVLALGLASGLLASVVPLAIAPLVDGVLPAGLRGILIETTLLLLVAVVAGFAIDAVRNVSVVRVKTRLSSQMQQAVMHRLIGLPPAFFRRFSIADLANRALGIDAVEQYLGDATLTGILTAIFSLVSFAIIVAQDAVIGAVCGLIGIATLGAFALEAALLVKHRRKAMHLGGALSAFVFQTLTGVAKIRAAAARNRVYVRWLHRFLETRRVAAIAHKIEYRYAIFSAVWPSIATLAIIVTIVVVRHGAFEAGKFFTVLAAFEQMLVALLGLGFNVSSMISVVPVYERLQPILEAVPERDPAAGDPGPLSGAISIHDVSFSYEGASRPALSHVSVEIEAGSFVAIVGPSGSGKSTLLRLLLGFEAPSTGWIAYDHHALDSLDIVSVRGQMGAVLQTAKLLPGSIFDNISGNAILSRDQAWEAARRVGLADDIEKMPMKLDTVIGANGAGLSGGQRQRIVIARAVAAAPKLIFFDEATSALDNATQAVVSQTLAAMAATRIVIAHRLTTVVDADRILVMEAGRIVQQGRYGELLTIDGPFKTLAERQQL